MSTTLPSETFVAWEPGMQRLVYISHDGRVTYNEPLHIRAWLWLFPPRAILAALFAAGNLPARPMLRRAKWPWSRCR